MCGMVELTGMVLLVLEGGQITAVFAVVPTQVHPKWYIERQVHKAWSSLLCIWDTEICVAP